MSNAHHFDRSTRSCVCASAWNWYAEDCSSIAALPEMVAAQQVLDEDYPDLGFFECRKGHAFCGRH